MTDTPWAFLLAWAAGWLLWDLAASWYRARRRNQAIVTDLSTLLPGDKVEVTYTSAYNVQARVTDTVTDVGPNWIGLRGWDIGHLRTAPRIYSFHLRLGVTVRRVK